MIFRLAGIAILAVSSAVGHAPSPYRLPQAAQITVGHSVIGPDKASVEGFCENWSLSKREVRRMFASYHLLKEGELHDFYLEPDCWIDGKIVVNGKTFTWRARLGNTLSTDWPDGKTKMLGGKHSQDPSGGEVDK